ncbi:alkylphosphonate utilization protein [Endozoicomonas sp. SCSIO W0465]|uniref:PhnA domain-containing protein n=1 Tax=Endozoicomonas sp. SCSIO W0465 TaxID=2918516 RepID=UPI002075ED0C|nr:alkylphosphonate utilization protein [Endozoicomonas sp. SCSIO W0465]USE38838.1 PhnA domain-containing protein [Endozoicomonas sp. SCSIO W0465]
MTTEQTLMERSGAQCELCNSKNDLRVYPVPPKSDAANPDHSILVCDNCLDQINQPSTMDSNHWRCLNDSVWSQVPAVQVMAFRLLNRLSSQGWAQDLLDMMYLDEETREWAESGLSSEESETPTLDSNGSVLNAGDTVTLIKDLPVKGAGFTAKRGTAVRNIALTGNPEQIEGRVNGVRIVLLTKYLKKA